MWVHFWELRCWKSARGCGEKHISKSKRQEHHSVGAFLEVEILKKCTPLWRQAHFEVNMGKAPHFRTTLGSWEVQKVHAVVTVLAQSTSRTQNVKSTPRSDHFSRSTHTFLVATTTTTAATQNYTTTTTPITTTSTTTTPPFNCNYQYNCNYNYATP